MIEEEEVQCLTSEEECQKIRTENEKKEIAEIAAAQERRNWEEVRERLKKSQVFFSRIRSDKEVVELPWDTIIKEAIDLEETAQLLNELMRSISSRQ